MITKANIVWCVSQTQKQQNDVTLRDQTMRILPPHLTEIATHRAALDIGHVTTHGPCDYTTDFWSGATSPRGQVYQLSVPATKAMEKCHQTLNQ